MSAYALKADVRPEKKFHKYVIYLFLTKRLIIFYSALFEILISNFEPSMGIYYNRRT